MVRFLIVKMARICDICDGKDPSDLMAKWDPKIKRKGLKGIEDICLACQDDVSVMLVELWDVHHG